jgi:exopolysaccharide biosynthesis polyprenyl glycosylphosphotransferase
VALLAAVPAYVSRPGADRAVWSEGVYLAATAVAPVVWLGVLALAGGYELRHLEDGPGDWRHVLEAGALLLGVVGLLTWATPLQVPRDYVLLFVFLAGALTLSGRLCRRRALRTRRRRGECIQRVLAVGQPLAVRRLAQRLALNSHPATVLVGCCLAEQAPDRPGAEPGGGPAGRRGEAPVPVLGGLDDVPAAVCLVGADTVAVLPCPELDDSVVRRLAWALEGRARHFVVVPGLAEVAFPRLTVRPIGGLPVLHVQRPRLSGPGWLAKGVLDRTVAFVALMLTAPLMLAIGLAVRATTPGPALFRQTRVGLDGRPFTFLKFRTMHVDAERLRDGLAQYNINADGLLFKVRGDPRVTAIGAVLRRSSLDELPQLFNVLIGQMSLVGPRPALPEEVARYSDDVRRRLLVRPGMTGLWQVSGRSDLPWEEAIRLDLRYVDNWSLGLDLAILSRTVSAVLHGAGAY